MANIKNIAKKLVNAGYSEEKLVLMTEKEIRETYKNYKSSPKEDDSILSSPNTTPENNDNANKEEITMKKDNNTSETINNTTTVEKKESTMTKSVMTNQKELVNKLSNIIKAYDPYTAYIDDYKQYSNAVAINCELDQKFIHTCKEYGYDVEVSFCYSLAKSLASGKFDSAENVIIDYINSLIKEGDSMKQQNNVTTNSSTTEVKEEFTMEALVKRIAENKIQDKDYIDRPTLKTIMNEQFGFNFSNRSTRTEMVEALMNKYKDSLKVADENTAEDNNISIEDSNITHDNAPESIEIEEEAEVKITDELATKILEKMIRQADTNRTHNFISDWMLTSIISELVIGHPLKDKGHEYYKSFTAEQRKILIDIRKAFIDKASLITKTKNGKVTGYYIPAKILVWGRHIYLGVACVYRYISKNRILAEYHVSLNGIKNVSTGNIAALDDAAYETLDTKCIFVM